MRSASATSLVLLSVGLCCGDDPGKDPFASGSASDPTTVTSSAEGSPTGPGDSEAEAGTANPSTTSASTVADESSATTDPTGDPPDPADCVPEGVDNTQYDYGDDVPPSPEPPGGLPIEQVPMFVTIGFDDNGYSGLPGSGGDGGLTWATDMMASRSNPAGTGNPHTYDGTPATLSFYFTSVYIDVWQSESPTYVKQAWHTAMMNGHEVGNHTQSHLPGHGGPMFTVEQWLGEIDTCNGWLTKPFDPAETSGTPNPMAGLGASMSQLYGFRTPYLEYGDATLAAVAERGFWYDTSIEEGYQYEQDGTNFNWPFTLDDGSPGHDVLVKWGLKQPITAHPGLWEMPVYPVVVPPDDVAAEYGIEPGLRAKLAAAVDWWDPESAKITGFDYNLWSDTGIGGFALTREEFVATLKYSLDLRLQGNRAPFMFGAHTDYYSSKYTAPPNTTHTDRQQAIEEFLDYALAKPEVRVVSEKQILDWIRDPVPLGCEP